MIKTGRMFRDLRPKYKVEVIKVHSSNLCTLLFLLL